MRKLYYIRLFLGYPKEKRFNTPLISSIILLTAKIKGQNNYIMISNNVGGTALHVAADIGSIKVNFIAYVYF